MGAYYNEIDPYCAAWLRNLMAAGLIAPGEVDERSIADVEPADLVGFTQCHFFAGIGVWSYALRLAGWPDDRPAWTGSCPCQPFSPAGKGDGAADPRHLWPAWFRLIGECRPHVLFGEQVSGIDGLAWLDLVHADLEARGYALGALTLPAAGIGAPHGRHRIFFVADAAAGRWRTWESRLPGQPQSDDAGRGANGLMADSSGDLEDARRQSAGRGLRRPEQGQGPDGGWAPDEPERSSDALDLGDTLGPRLEIGPLAPDENGVVRLQGAALGAASPLRGPWGDADWLYCTDGKWRPVEPGTRPLVAGASARVGRLRAYGNALCAEAAAAFVRVYMERG